MRSRLQTLFRSILCAALGAGCEESINPSLEDLPCAEDGECVSGYVCSEQRVCVREDSVRRTVMPPDAGAVLKMDAAMVSTGAAGAAVRDATPTAGMSATAGSAAGSGGQAGAPPKVAPMCQAPQLLCGERCLDARSDPENCGACGRTCVAADANQAVCRDGECAAACADDRALCEGACVDTSVDVNHCGACGLRCKGKRICDQGRCVADPETVVIDIDQLEQLLDMFGLTLGDLAEALGVDESELPTTKIKQKDLEALGINAAALALLGLTNELLDLIGIET